MANYPTDFYAFLNLKAQLERISQFVDQPKYSEFQINQVDSRGKLSQRLQKGSHY